MDLKQWERWRVRRNNQSTSNYRSNQPKGNSHKQPTNNPSAHFKNQSITQTQRISQLIHFPTRLYTKGHHPDIYFEYFNINLTNLIIFTPITFPVFSTGVIPDINLSALLYICIAQGSENDWCFSDYGVVVVVDERTLLPTRPSAFVFCPCRTSLPQVPPKTHP